MKKCLIFLLCFAVLMTLAACSGTASTAPKQASETGKGSEEAPPESTKPDPKTPAAAPLEEIGDPVPEDFFEPEPPRPTVTKEAEADGIFLKVFSQPEPIYGISLHLPSDWTYSTRQSGADDVTVRIQPIGERIFGSIDIRCASSFGVCGTGLVSEEIVFNGRAASKGTYHNEPEWSYISISGAKGCAIINETMGWYDDYEDELWQILSTVEFFYPN